MKWANELTEPETSQNTTSSGLWGLCGLVFGLHRHAAGRQRRAHGAAEVELAGPAEPALGRQPGREPAGQRLHLAAQLDEVVARRPQEVDLVGKRLHGRARHRLQPLGLGEAAAHLALDGLLERLDAVGDGLAGDLLGHPAALLISQHGREQRGDERLRRERPQDPVGEERLAARSRVRSTSEAADRVAGEPADRVLVAVEDQVAELVTHCLGELREVHRLALTVTAGIQAAGAEVLRGDPVAELRREVQVEKGVEGRPVGGALAARRGERGPQVFALDDVDLAERAHRIDRLGRTDRDTRLAQRTRELDAAVEQVHDSLSWLVARA